MSPTLTQQERSLSPISRTADSPDSAFTLLLEAANSKTTSVDPGQVLTPPQSPDGSLFKEMRKVVSIDWTDLQRNVYHEDRWTIY